MNCLVHITFLVLMIIATTLSYKINANSFSSESGFGSGAGATSESPLIKFRTTKANYFSDRPYVNSHSRRLNDLAQTSQSLGQGSDSAYFENLIIKQEDLLYKLQSIKYSFDPGWDPVYVTGVFKQGDVGEGVQSIKERLNQFIEKLNIPGCASQPYLQDAAYNVEAERSPADKAPKFDSCMVENVKVFQRLHGLLADGVVGPKTIKAMNVSLEERIAEVSVNLKRLKSFKDKQSRKAVLINIADYSIQFIYDHKPVFKSKVIVGKSENKTPIFSDQLTQFVVNPPWNVPPSIVAEIAPKILENPFYLEEKNFSIYEDGYNGTVEVDPTTIDWSRVTETNFTYFLVQNSGAANPLGEVKYLFPNHHAVYVHDTNQPYLFTTNNLMRSHGCIRMQDPFLLAEAIAQYDQNDAAWDAMENRLTSRESVDVNLKEPIDVHIVYWTSWVGAGDEPQFRPDIYSHDYLAKSEYLGNTELALTSN